METLVIYDDVGYVLSTSSSSLGEREPVGVPFIIATIPDGKRIKKTDGIGVDVSKSPHELILEDIPPSETDMLKAKVDAQELALMELAEIIAGGAV